MSRLSLTALRQAVCSGDLSQASILAACRRRFEQFEPQCHAFVSECYDAALRSSCSPPLDCADALPLLGSVFTVKDSFCTAGIPTTAGSAMLSQFIPPYSATVVSRLEAAGAVMVGKTRMDEFGMGNTTPGTYTLEGHSPGGSSGGSAVSVQMGACHFSIGSDTGGSIRQPASQTGLVGYKPSYGMLSRHGLISYASSLDCPGILSDSVEDVSAVAKVLWGRDPHDSTSVDPLYEDRTHLHSSNSSKRSTVKIGLPKEVFIEELDPAVIRLLREALERLSARSPVPVEVIDVSLPHLPYALSAYYILATAEASSNLARYRGTFFGSSSISQSVEDTRAEFLGEEVKRRILAGTFVLSRGTYDRYFANAQRVRRLVQQDFESCLLSSTLTLGSGPAMDNGREGCDALLMPVLPQPLLRTVAAATATTARLHDDAAIVEGYAEDVFTVGPSLAGLPAVSVPLVQATAGTSVQLVGRWRCDEQLLSLSRFLQAF